MSNFEPVSVYERTVYVITTSATLLALFLYLRALYTLLSPSSKPALPTIRYYFTLQHPAVTPAAMPPSKRSQSNCLSIPQGNWRSTIKVSLAGTSIVLICNSLLLMSSLVKVQEDVDVPGMRTLYTGSCSLSARYNTIAHFIINIASTIILSSSGYCMVRHLQGQRHAC